MLPALVLSAGLGTRLDPLTRLVAKPAVPVAGRALIERLLGWLRRQGVRDAVINLHHRPETIAAVVGDGAHLGLRVRYSWERELLGSAGGPRHALPLVFLDSTRVVAPDAKRDAFAIVNGDTLCDLDLAGLVDAHERAKADVTLAVIPNPAPDRYNGIEADRDGRVRAFVRKGHAHGSWHFVGVQVVNASVFASLADDQPSETIAGLYRDRVAHGDGRICVWPAVEGQRAEGKGQSTAPEFVDIGTPRDYLDAALRLAGGDNTLLVAAEATVDGATHITRSIVWPGARIGRGAHLDECIVAGPVTVPAGFHARHSVLVPESVAHAGDPARVVDGLAVFPLSASRPARASM